MSKTLQQQQLENDELRKKALFAEKIKSEIIILDILREELAIREKKKFFFSKLAKNANQLRMAKLQIEIQSKQNFINELKTYEKI